MKRIILLATMALISVAGTTMYAQKGNPANTAVDKKVQKEAKKAKARAEEEALEQASYQLALEALKNKQFVLEADRVIFRNGMSTFVTSNTNFVLMDKNKSTVQVAFNTAYPGPNGIGGVTVDGNASNLKISIDKKGNVNYSFNAQGIGISAQIFITMTSGSNKATVTVNPNFSNRTLTLTGEIVPLELSNLFKGRSW